MFYFKNLPRLLTIARLDIFTDGVTLTLRFKPPSVEVDTLTGVLRNGSCALAWATNSSSKSGRWGPRYRAGHRPLYPPSPPPRKSVLFMGYTMVTRLIDGVEYRYTEWPKFLSGECVAVVTRAYFWRARFCTRNRFRLSILL